MYQIVCLACRDDYTPTVVTFRPYAADEAGAVPEPLVEELARLRQKYRAFEMFEVSVFRVPDDQWAGPTFQYETVWIDKPVESFAEFDAFLKWVQH